MPFKIGPFVAACLNEGIEVMLSSGTPHDDISFFLWEERIA